MVLTGAAFLAVKANWLRGRGIGRPREDRNTTITDKRRDEGDLLVMFDVIYPTAPGVPLNGPLDVDGVLLSTGRVCEEAAAAVGV